MEIDDKTFGQIVSQLDSYMLDESLVECVERAIVALNRYRDLEKVPILMDEMTYDERTKQLEPCNNIEIKTVTDRLVKIKKNFENDKWIN